MNRVVLQITKDGSQLIHSDQPIKVYTVDERCPRDRIYRHSHVAMKVGSVDAVLGNEPIGFQGDQTLADATAQFIVDELEK